MKPLWEHQKRDIDRYLTHASLVNTSDCGTGKSRTLIEVIARKQIPTLILAPKSILQCAWGNDIEEFAPHLSYSIAYASNRAEAFSSNAMVKITNVDALTWLQKNPKYLEQFREGFLIIDESTAIKNPQSQRTKAAIAIRPIFKFCTCMSGTIAPQGIIDIWSQVYMVDQGQRLGNSFYRFRNNTYTPIKKGMFTEWKEKEGMAEAVADLISDITIRNRREDCLDLPPNLVVRRRIKLSDAHMKKYTQLKKQALVELESGDVSAVNAAVLIQKLLQLTSGAVYDEFGEVHSVDPARYELIADLVEERDHTVVFFNWAHQRANLEKEFSARKLKYKVIDGSVPQSLRNLAVEEFQSGKLDAILCQIQSAAHGITLTKGATTIFASALYNAEHYEQAKARVFRGGQTRKTETILIIAENTVEDEVYTRLMDKTFKLSNLLEILR